jgi:hypothetical protein
MSSIGGSMHVGSGVACTNGEKAYNGFHAFIGYS